MNVLIVGNGMYVCGRGTNGFGTILPAILCSSNLDRISSVHMVGSNPTSIKEAKDKVADLQKELGTQKEVQFTPTEEIDREAYLKVAKEMQGEKLAIISTPDHLHFEMAKNLIELGFHLLVVKPLATTVQEVKELSDLCKKHNRYGMVEFHKRFDRSNMKLRQAVQENKIGDPLYFIIEYSQRKVIPTEVFAGWVEKTNILQYLGIHYLDMVYFVTGAKPKRVMATGESQFLLSEGIKVHDNINCTVEWEGQDGKTFTSTHFTNWIDPNHTTSMSDQRIKVIGTKGRYEADQKNRGLSLVTDESFLEHINPDFCQKYLGSDNKYSYRGYGIESVQTFLSDCFEIEAKRVQPADLEGKRPTFADSIIPTQILEAAKESLANHNKWVQI